MPFKRRSNEIIDALLKVRRGLLGVALFSAIINLLMLAPALYMLQVYDRVLASGSGMTLAMLTLMLIGLYAFMALLDALRGLVVIRLGTQVDMGLNERVYRAAFQAALKSGRSDTGQALKDLTHLRQFASGSALFAFFDAPWFPLYLLVLYFFHPWLGALATVGAALLLGLAWFNQHWSSAPLAESGRLSALASRHAEGDLRHAEASEAMGMQAGLRQRWQALHHGFLVQQGLASDRAAVLSAWTRSLRLALQSLVLGLGALLAIDGEITPGMMIAGSILVGRVLGPLDQVIGAWRQWLPARLAYQRLSALLQECPPAEAGMSLPVPRGQLRVEQVCSSVPDARKATLGPLSFSLEAGEMLGVLGPSGSGKSSLARVLVAARPVLSGHVRLDGADLHAWRAEERGAHVGYLPQDVQLFAGSVAQNIARFGAASSEDVIDAARMAGVHELILQLPQGYDTLLGEGGAGLSGGQRQRIGLARALYRLPALIVLDEPNANLDEAGEKALLGAIASLRREKRTLLVITHKPALLACADKLLLMREGRVQAFGPAQALLAERAHTARAAARPTVSSRFSLGIPAGGQS